MNIYLFGINTKDDIYHNSMDQIACLYSEFPQLDYKNIWSFYDKNIFCCSVHTNHDLCTPKEYVLENENEILLYDGCVIDASNKISLIKPKDIISKWERKTTDFEGQFSLVRIDKKKSTITLVTDFMGMGQVYYYRKDNTWIVSNHIGILQKITRINGLDNYGVSLLLTMGWIAGKHTLAEGIHVVPGGHVWKWRSLKGTYKAKNYYPIRKLNKKKQKSTFDICEATLLSDQLAALCSAVKTPGRTLYCPITGGRDSRVMLSLLLRGGGNGSYFLDGSSKSEEGKIAKEIATKYELNYQNHPVGVNALEGRWDELCRTLIVQNYGMVSLWQVCDLLRQEKKIETLDVLLYGVGGEIGRRFYKNPFFFIGKNDLETVTKKLSKCLFRNYGGLVKSEAMALSSSFIKRWVGTVLKDGINTAEIPDYFYAFERVRRWAGSNFRKLTPEVDVYSPFCSRPFVEMAFSLVPVYRYSEPLHFGMLSLLPDLHQLRFENGAWKSQIPWVNLFLLIMDKYSIKKKKLKSKFVPTLDRGQFLKKNLHKIREVCLDQGRSKLWDFIDKEMFEKVTSRKVGGNYIEYNAEVIYQIATLFYYRSYCMV